MNIVTQSVFAAVTIGTNRVLWMLFGIYWNNFQIQCEYKLLFILVYVFFFVFKSVSILYTVCMKGNCSVVDKVDTSKSTYSYMRHIIWQSEREHWQTNSSKIWMEKWYRDHAHYGIQLIASQTFRFLVFLLFSFLAFFFSVFSPLFDFGRSRSRQKFTVCLIGGEKHESMTSRGILLNLTKATFALEIGVCISSSCCTT